MDKAMNTVGTVDVALSFDTSISEADRISALYALLVQGFTVTSPHVDLVSTLDTALEIAARERKYAVARGILQILEDLGI